jgi:hypothetical protein
MRLSAGGKIQRTAEEDDDCEAQPPEPLRLAEFETAADTPKGAAETLPDFLDGEEDEAAAADPPRIGDERHRGRVRSELAERPRPPRNLYRYDAPQPASTCAPAPSLSQTS